MLWREQGTFPQILMRTAPQRWHHLVIDMHLPEGLFSTEAV